MFLVLSRGRRSYHFLFAVLLFIVACWDLGIFLVMIRNSNPNEVLLYQNVVTIPVLLFPAFLYHFTTTTNQVKETNSPVDIGFHPPYEHASQWVGMNLLMLDEHTAIVERSQLPLIRMLEQEGFTVIPVPLRHARTMSGAVHCVTLDLERD